MADEYVGGQTYTSGGQSATAPLTIPAEVQVGDVLYAYVAWGVNGATLPAATPAGWDVAANISNPGNTINSTLYRRVAQSGDASSTVTFQLSGGASRLVTAVLRAYRGVDGGNPEDVAVSTNAGTSGDVVALSATVVTDGAASVLFYTGRGGVDPVWVLPSGYGNVQSVVAQTTPYWSTQALDREVSAGATGDLTAQITTDHNHWNALHLVLRPAADEPVELVGEGVATSILLTYVNGFAQGVEAGIASGITLPISLAIAEGTATGTEAGITAGTAVDLSLSYAAGASVGAETTTVGGAETSIPLTLAEGSASAVEAGSSEGIPATLPIAYGDGDTTATEAGVSSGDSIGVGITYGVGSATSAGAGEAVGERYSLPIGYSDGQASATESTEAVGYGYGLPITFRTGESSATEDTEASGVTFVLRLATGAGVATGLETATTTGLPLTIALDYSDGTLGQPATDTDYTAGNLYTGWEAGALDTDYTAGPITANTITAGELATNLTAGPIRLETT